LTLVINQWNETLHDGLNKRLHAGRPYAKNQFPECPARVVAHGYRTATAEVPDKHGNNALEKGREVLPAALQQQQQSK
jgi:hypothetical protein